MKKVLVVSCICILLATLGNGCITRTATRNGVTNKNGRSINDDNKCISRQTFWIWQHEYWSN